MVSERMFSDRDRISIRVSELNEKLETARLQGEMRRLQEVIQLFDQSDSSCSMWAIGLIEATFKPPKGNDG